MAVKKGYLIALRFIDPKNAKKIMARRAEQVLNETDAQVLSSVCTWLDDYFEGNLSTINLSIQANGTAFQKAIWELVCKIPYGQVVSYKDLAKSYCEKYHVESMSAQAIGKAVGCNPIALVIPCHRVIGADGSMMGYAYGLEKKKFLLELERKANV